jgi:hypothetical protein
MGHYLHRGPLVLNNLDDYRQWPIKHRHWTFDLVEDDSHEIWVSTSDLRRFYERFPSDKALKDVYHRSMLYAKDTKTYYLSDRIMRTELRKSKSYSSYTDVLKFLDWYERNVAKVIVKKRINEHLDDGNAHRDHHAQKISDRPVPLNLAPPTLDAATEPFTPEERWAMQQSTGEPKRVYHPEARKPRLTLAQGCRALGKKTLHFLLTFLRGERNLFLTFLVGIVVGWVPGWLFDLIAPATLDWTVSYLRVMWAAALVVPVAALCSVLFVVALTRSTLKAWKRPFGMLWATAFYVLIVMPLAPLIFLMNYDAEMLDYWWASVRGKYEAINVYADPYLGRIVLKGPMRFGSADALEKVLVQNKKYTLVQIESPGGFVIEGMRMAKLVEQRKMDTVSLESCASACTFVLAAGTDRYLGPEARVGFHRSGTRYGPVGNGWSETDHQIAKFYSERGVNDTFIDKALTPSIRQIWLAPHADMYAAKYATLRWSERKSGY